MRASQGLPANSQLANACMPPPPPRPPLSNAPPPPLAPFGCCCLQDMVFSGHVHAYERTHPMYKYEVGREEGAAPEGGGQAARWLQLHA